MSSMTDRQQHDRISSAWGVAGDPARRAIQQAYRADEATCLQSLLAAARLEDSLTRGIQETALALAGQARTRSQAQWGVAAFMREYDLSSEEGVLLMCLAEALLRIPDPDTADRLIRDHLAKGKWDEHIGRSTSLWVNASTWGLLLTGRLLLTPWKEEGKAQAVLQRLVARSGEPVVRVALSQAMTVLAQQFVLGRSLDEALRRGKGQPAHVRYSFDCLGEAARTAADARRYFDAYMAAIECLAKTVSGAQSPLETHSISIKLSALHPRYEFAQRRRVLAELAPRLHTLAMAAKSRGVGLTLDAEEADRLELSLDLFGGLLNQPELAGWNGLGLAVQAYQKRALPVLKWVQRCARAAGVRIPVRLVKGAYWDTEVKRTQERGLDGYPVFTRKAATDVSYLACARFMLDDPGSFYPQFATHNAHTMAWLLQVGEGCEFEFQRLHGMGEPLYDALEQQFAGRPYRIYAPVGSYEELLPYLVRRLLENGANTSFVNQLSDENMPLDSLVVDPVTRLEAVACTPHPQIPLPADLYQPTRRNAQGLDLTDSQVLVPLLDAMQTAAAGEWDAAPLIADQPFTEHGRIHHAPADAQRVTGTVLEATGADLDTAMTSAAAAMEDWDRAGGEARARVLEKAADTIEADAMAFMAMIVHEGGRTVADAHSEVREAVDFCRYYAAAARNDFAGPLQLPGPTGEQNELWLRGRGVFACISPWNFPLAIFVGQVGAALAAGNAVVAKPARQTPLVAARAIRAMHAAGVPAGALHLLPGSGAGLGDALLAHPALAGIAFTGSTETAWTLQQGLARRRGPILPLIAETGGQNVMIADSSALPEQLVVDAMQSAFNSAGQRCSALRVLFIQEEIADTVIAMLAGAMDELVIGDPARLETDIGPVIDTVACQALEAHVQRMSGEARVVKAVQLPPETASGSFFPPTLIELNHLDQLDGEVFGPVLHIIRYPAGDLERVIDQVNGCGYGLTLGVQSRISTNWERVRARARVGNLYINRNMIGAVVGVQPFGGEGLSGTGPKAGGPHYLHRFATERTVSVNTAAVGGNASLLALDE